MRVGAGGPVVDNLVAGGLRANIDIESGVVDSDGLFIDGTRATHHPDTGVKFKGTQIPQWDKVTEVCLKAASMVSQSIVAGWDIAITANGEVEIIEVNSLPDNISCRQLTTRKGDKHFIEDAVFRVTGRHFKF